MNIKLFLYIVIVLLGIILANGNDPHDKKRRWYVIIIMSLLVLESSLRSVDVGPDTVHYYSSFLANIDRSWSEIWALFRTSYIEGEGKDPGFLVFMKLVQHVSSDFNVFLFVCALIFFVPLGFILYRYSSHILQLVFAFSLYVALFNIVALSGIRQQLATGITFVAFLLIGNGHKWKSLLLIFLASLIHISALFFLLVPFVGFLFKKRLKLLHLLSFIAVPNVVAYAGPIMLFLASFLSNDYYEGYGQSESESVAYTYILLMEILSLFCLISIRNNTLQNDHDIRILYSMLPLLTVTVPLVTLNGAMIRVGQYFTLYMMLLVPIAIDNFSKGENRKIIYFGMIAALIVLTLKGDGFEYYFFWQNTLK